MENEPSRRSVLLAGSVLAGAAGVAGVLGGFRSDGPTFGSGYTTSLDDPIVRGGPSPDDGPPHHVALITSDQEAERLIDWSVFPDHERDEWREIDYGTSFVAVFVSRYEVLPSGTADGSVPRSTVEGDTFVFELGQDDVYGGFDYGEELFTQIEKWDHGGSGRPERAVVRLL